MKRFQEANVIVKACRYRHYLYVPFKWIWFKYFKHFELTDNETLKVERINEDYLWKILIGIAQGNMHWYYTEEEVKSQMDKIRKSLLNNEESK